MKCVHLCLEVTLEKTFHFQTQLVHEDVMRTCVFADLNFCEYMLLILEFLCGHAHFALMMGYSD